jgi:hypothetical protein
MWNLLCVEMKNSKEPRRLATLRFEFCDIF